MYEIVIIDDEELIRKGLTRIVEISTQDFQVVGEAVNGREGYELVMKLNPQVVVVDIKMPVMDGLEMIDRIKQLNGSIKFIILSAHTDYDYTRHAIKSGVVDYLMKPVNRLEFADLLNHIKQVLDDEQKLKNKDQVPSGSEKQPKIYSVKNESKTIEVAKKYINANYFNDISLEQIADYVNMNTNYFSTLFKNETGENFIDYITRLRIEQSKILLRDAGLKIYEICSMVGYYSPKHFSKLFKDIVGTTPTQYRNKIM